VTRAPYPPPTSTIRDIPRKSYAFRSSRATRRLTSAIAWLNTAALSRLRAKRSKALVPVDNSVERHPVFTLYRRCPHIERICVPDKTAKECKVSCVSDRKYEPVGVRENDPSSISKEIEAGKGSHQTIQRLCMCSDFLRKPARGTRSKPRLLHSASPRLSCCFTDFRCSTGPLDFLNEPKHEPGLPMVCIGVVVSTIASNCPNETGVSDREYLLPFV
jgi:hypothetical protein